jgi:hypothetical protein
VVVGFLFLQDPRFPEIASMKHDDLYVHLIGIFRDLHQKGVPFGS